MQTLPLLTSTFNKLLRFNIDLVVFNYSQEMNCIEAIQGGKSVFLTELSTIIPSFERSRVLYQDDFEKLLEELNSIITGLTSLDHTILEFKNNQFLKISFIKDDIKLVEYKKIRIFRILSILDIWILKLKSKKIRKKLYY